MELWSRGEVSVKVLLLSFPLCSIQTFLAKWNSFYKSSIFRNLTSLEETSFRIAILSEKGSPELCLWGADLRCEGVLNPEHFLTVKSSLRKTEQDLMLGRVLHRLRHGKSSPFIKNVQKRILFHSSGNNKPLLNPRSYYQKKKKFKYWSFIHICHGKTFAISMKAQVGYKTYAVWRGGF